ncbi:CAP (Cysteine-rich secretory proteins, Antigen 5, and Pathogenesis-related 1 protein) superfamily protein [Arabidopsis thaliana]|uniref:CAP (Cysteine-rich secretory proteins, Antigen 5, and Pathogenesis-related 1 protein) superfamily protein n=2 Tax=Arabidopsis thaliana TaxID=3702 RepID=Q9SL82_ARATH|nr:CAP (Cysteine-rich secretory proteins, Antigen 5, and Pathogenesis-related 1 protein) superfamily protein [Arabidopsis thaliana]AAD24397.1 putative pathogenesis-related protein [Arabidopsis thaliana]AEC06951.1 CAP (Cysteine-rich secretory proteins, Antigen 5, and Pathogenesis-related 1 protein) superfamily protein [Arabidopsis thaliana]|eukprot:NP_179588.1 CAP (Cysteine-rich secretory proteins, Antigen 5, and Pathogenesis-related 1 protein) superfamily protein [Arabidopsis thaliana]
MSFSGYSFIVLTLLSIVLTQIYGLRSFSRMDDLQPAETLAVHNQIRAADQKLAAHAQRYANVRSQDCAMKYSTDGTYGENIAAGWVQPMDTMSGPIATKFWFTEKPYYNYATNKCSEPCGHYTQIVANQSTHLGCGTVRCFKNEYVWVVCNYAPRPMGDANTRPY